MNSMYSTQKYMKSPQYVTSSCPTSTASSLIWQNQSFPSPSPYQYDNYTDHLFGEYYSKAHGSYRHSDSNLHISQNVSEMSFVPYIKSEEPIDVFDMDTQKVFYASNEKLTPLQIQQNEHHFFGRSNAHDLKHSYFPSNICKQEFSSQIVHQQQEQINSDVNGNQFTCSSSKLPTTTTPQENETRTSIEAAMSSLPTNTTNTPTDITLRTSNRNQSPKKYKCLSCNRWFSSVGHLNRHYKTTIHRKLVRSSGRSDPAMDPPTQDQNALNHHNRDGPIQMPSILEKIGRPHSAQYTQRLEFQKSAFQENKLAFTINSTTGTFPNGPAGPSIPPSQQRPLLIQSNNKGQMLVQEPHTTNKTDFNIILPLDTQQLTQNYFRTTGSHEADMEQVKQETTMDYNLPVPFIKENDNSYISYKKSVQSDNCLFMEKVIARQEDTLRSASPSIYDSFNKISVNPQDITSRQPTQLPSLIYVPTPNLTEPKTKLHCINCNKTFQKSCYLTQHNATHHSTITRSFKCTKCGKNFSTMKQRNDHFDKHTSDTKPYRCDKVDCGKCFNHMSDLRRHSWVHKNYKPYKCQTCCKGFIRNDHLLRHTAMHQRKLAKKLATTVAQL